MAAGTVWFGGSCSAKIRDKIDSVFRPAGSVKKQPRWSRPVSPTPTTCRERRRAGAGRTSARAGGPRTRAARPVLMRAGRARVLRRVAAAECESDPVLKFGRLRNRDRFGETLSGAVMIAGPQERV